MAEKEIIRSIQRRHFGEELISLGKGKFLKSCSSIAKLDPFIDDEGILRVGGRIKRSAVASEMQHPVLLPKSCRIAELVIRWCHEQVAHAGRGMTMNQIRSSGFWVTRCNSLVRCIILKCVRCKQLRGRLQQQKMADLPKERMSEEPPFTYCGVDLFGSFLVKDGRKEVKRYGALYTCLSSRAIHIEVVYSLSTDSFIMSLRRFVGRRGNVKMIRSDSGSNLVISRAISCISRNGSYQDRQFFKRKWWRVDDLVKKSTTIKQHGRSVETPDLECKSNFKVLTEDSWK